MAKNRTEPVRHASFFKKLALGLTIVLGLGAIATFSYNLYDEYSVKTVESKAYEIASVDGEGKLAESETAISMTKLLSVDGLKCELKSGAKIKYQLFFYDEYEEFVSATEQLSVDFDGTAIPKKAKSVRVMITPTEDEDGVVTDFEKSGYADQLKITVNR